MLATQSATRRAAAPRAMPTPITAIASGKGGVGKTWLAGALASVLGRRNRRTLLIDADFGLANVDVQLGLKPEADLASVARGLVDMAGATTPVLGGPGRAGGFDVISGHSGSGALAHLRPEEINELARQFRRAARHYDETLLDLAAGVDPATLRMARGADRLIVVTTEEPTALTDAYAFIKLLRLATPSPPPRIVVNMAERRQTGRAVYDQLAKACEKFLGFRPALLGVVPRDADVPAAIRAQKPLLVRSPTSAALAEVIAVSERLDD